MALVASVDYPAKRIYLSAVTADADLDTLAVYREVRALRRTTAAHRAFNPIIVAGGNIEKIAGQTYTPAYVQLLNGCRLVPYNGSHSIRLVRDTFTDDGFAGRDCFDRTPLGASVEVNIDVDFPEIEIREVTVGGSTGPTAESIAAAIGQRIIDNGLSNDALLRILLAALAGKTAGLGTDTEQYLAQDGITPRITAQFDANNNRTSVTLNGA